MKTLIVDDEQPARDELCYMLESVCPEATLFSARNGSEAMALAREHKVDVVFLDINMPGQSGLEVAAYLSSLNKVPYVVFATAYSEHAVEAFSLAAVDYLVKPYDERRLDKTVQRIRARRESSKSAFSPVSDYLTSQLYGKIWGEADSGEKVLVEHDEIAYIEADRKKVFALRTDGARFRLKPTLKELESSLGSGFLRVHKGYLVNLQYISEAQRWYSGGYSLKLKDQAASELQVSRRFAPRFKEVTGL